MHRTAVTLLALLLLPLASLRAQEGQYRLEGVSSVGSLTGSAQVERRGEGLWLTLERSDGLRVAGALTANDALLQLDVALPAGAAGAIDPAAASVYRARYLPLGGRLVGRWEVRAGERVLESGRQTLIPVDEPTGRVRLAVSVDWEGRELGPSNLAAMRAWREAVPGVPLTHFLNAAYYTKPGADAAAVTSLIASALLPGDELGLHVHGWRSLFAAAGVTYRDRPTFWRGMAEGAQPGLTDSGHEVEIGAYEVDELRAVLRRSRALLGEGGFTIGPAFRAGGWMATPRVLEAIRGEGFTIDSSATDGRWHDELTGYALRARIPEVWPGVSEETQPYRIATAAGVVLEMPDTGALADYVTVDEMVAHVRRAAARLRPGQDLFVHVGFHQETAARYAARVSQALRELARDPALPLAVETLSDSAARAPE